MGPAGPICQNHSNAPRHIHIDYILHADCMSETKVCLLKDDGLPDLHYVSSIMPGSVARSDTRSTGDQEGVRSRLRSGNILSLKLIMKSFLRSFSPFR